MPLVFANPWGLLALLGVPVVLAIHFLHRHRRAIPVSTLFLLEIAREPARAGRRWHRLISSVPMWLQLLLVLLLTALLAEPRLPGSVVRVAVVVDDSASMRAFGDELARELAALDRVAGGRIRDTEWLVLPANPGRQRLYAGDSVEEVIEALLDWHPTGSWRDPSPALRVARDRVGPDGLVVYATDTPRDELAAGAALLSVGRALENVGVAGLDVVGGATWQSVLVNLSDVPARRTWTLEWNGAHTSPPAEVEIAAGGLVGIEGPLPEDATRMTLRLSEDAFPLDDVFPFVRPSPKPLYLAIPDEGVPPWLASRLIQSIPNLRRAAGAAADFALLPVEDGAAAAAMSGIVFAISHDEKAEFVTAPVTPTSHPLVRGLSWAGLVVEDVAAPPPMAGDTVLVWAGRRPMVSLRHVAAMAEPAADGEEESDPNSSAWGEQLILHFDPARSNLDRLPAAAVLFLRFAESLRDAKPATAWEQLDPGQSLVSFLPDNPTGALVLETLAADGTVVDSLPINRNFALAPEVPGFIRVRDDATIWLEGAVAFADARESDFRDRASADTIAPAMKVVARATSAPSAVWRLAFLLLALAALLALYYFSASKERAAPADSGKPVPLPVPVPPDRVPATSSPPPA